MVAVCDAAHYRFIMVDVGDAGRHSDGGVFSSSQFGKALANNHCLCHQLNLCPVASQNVPYVFVGDSAFPFKMNMMRPYTLEKG